jgi:hypothetical protein
MFDKNMRAVEGVDAPLVTFPFPPPTHVPYDRSVSQSRSVTTPSDKITDKITPTSDKINPKPQGISIIKISDLKRMADAQKDI